MCSSYEIHDFHGQFDSPTALRARLIETFGEQVPNTLDFQVGYFLGKQSKKFWIICQDDLKSMYQSLRETTKANVLLWCDGRSEGSSEDDSLANRKRKAPADPPVSKRQQMEDDVKETVKTLKNKHGEKYTLPLNTLWARMIAARNHDSEEDPPNIPAITGVLPKKEKKQSLAEAISSAAVTFAQAVQPGVQMASGNSSLVINQSTPPKTPSASRIGLSPGRVTELRICIMRSCSFSLAKIYPGTDQSYMQYVFVAMHACDMHV